ncbi:MAG: hypothetical protein OHK0013_25870 [Sandaracinaceae bacterium]
METTLGLERARRKDGVMQPEVDRDRGQRGQTEHRGARGHRAQDSRFATIRPTGRDAAALLAGTLLAACGAPGPTARHPHEPAPRVWAVAPHPDDEVLMAGETLAALHARGVRVDVYVVTNGDLGCERDGHRRQGETVGALAALGLPESRTHFLGYPDGHLARLAAAPRPPLARRAPDGSCGEGTGTYASRGAHGMDVHRARTGAAGAYTWATAVEDLAQALVADRPSDVYVAHPFDAHPDHATTYVLLREAIDAARASVRVHRAMVHAGPCWPAGSGLAPPCTPVRETVGTPLPPLPPPLSAWTFDERVRVADGGQRKRAVIAGYASQLETPDPADDWLLSFGRADEVFETEVLAPDGPGPAAVRRTDAREELHARWSAGRTLVLRAAGGATPGERLRLVCGPEGLTLRGTDLARTLPLPAPPVQGCEVKVWRLGADRGGLAELEVRVDGARRALWPWPSPDAAVAEEAE